MSWVRLWSDMPTDPKWRVVARKSGRPLSEVIAVFTFMLLNACANASERSERETERGELKNWSDEDVAAALDTDPEHISSIREAMQGKTLEGNKLTGWEKRQPKREDGSAERAKQWRERKRTQENAEKRPDTDSDTDTDSEENKKSNSPPEAENSVAASGPEEISGLNGSTKLIVETMAQWLSPWSPDLPMAHRTIADAVQIYGQQAVRDGFADLKAEHADGKIRAMSAKAFYGFVKRASEGRKTTNQHQSPSERAKERTRKLLAEVDAELAAGAPN